MLIEDKIKDLYPNTIWDIMSNATLRYDDENNPKFFNSSKDVEDFMKQLKSRAGDDVEINLIKYTAIDGHIDISIDHTYHIDITRIGYVED